MKTRLDEINRVRKLMGLPLIKEGINIIEEQEETSNDTNSYGKVSYKVIEFIGNEDDPDYPKFEAYTLEGWLKVDGKDINELKNNTTKVNGLSVKDGKYYIIGGGNDWALVDVNDNFTGFFLNADFGAIRGDYLQKLPVNVSGGKAVYLYEGQYEMKPDGYLKVGGDVKEGINIIDEQKETSNENVITIKVDQEGFDKLPDVLMPIDSPDVKAVYSGYVVEFEYGGKKYSLDLNNTNISGVRGMVDGTLVSGYVGTLSSPIDYGGKKYQAYLNGKSGNEVLKEYGPDSKIKYGGFADGNYQWGVFKIGGKWTQASITFKTV